MPSGIPAAKLRNITGGGRFGLAKPLISWILKRAVKHYLKVQQGLRTKAI
jgi:hypothetical protein